MPTETQDSLLQAAQIAARDSLRVLKGERALIVTNPASEADEISRVLGDRIQEAGGLVEIVYQGVKSQLDPMEDAVWEALKKEPDIYVSLSVNKIGKDLRGIAQPYRGSDGTVFDSITSFLLHGKKCSRGFWSPGITKALFSSSVPVDYRRLKEDCAWLAERLNQAASVRVTAPGGTDLVFSLEGRKAFVDDGDYSRAGSGGNLPAGEAYVSPVNGTAEGLIVYDGSMSTHLGTLLLAKPIRVEFEAGFITGIAGGEEAEALSETIRLGEEKTQDPLYRANARALGELGIGVNPLALVTGNMIVDEKAAGTCHFAIGSNYDHDGPALIHLDGVVREPTIELELRDGGRLVLLEDGVLRK